MSFEIIMGYLKSQYVFVKGKEKDYYCDKDNRIVATIDNEIITLFFDDSQDELETQYQKIAIPVINSTILKQEKNQTDRLELIGEYNDITLKNGIPTLSYNDELDRISGIQDKTKDSQRNLGSIGEVIIKNGEVSYLLKEQQKQIEQPKIESIQPMKQPNPIQVVKTREPIMIKVPKGRKRIYC